jgi:hypothetical protein
MYANFHYTRKIVKCMYVCMSYIYKTFEAFTYKNTMHKKSIMSVYANPTNNGQWKTGLEMYTMTNLRFTDLGN